MVNHLRLMRVCVFGLLLVSLSASAQTLTPENAAFLEWDANTDGATEKYYVYRTPRDEGDPQCLNPTNAYVKIGEVDHPTVTYADGPLAPNQAFCYYVTAWNRDHPESEASNVVWKRIPFSKAPLAPANLRETSGGG